MEEFLNFSEALDTQSGLEYDLETFFNVDLGGSGRNLSSELGRADLADIGTEFKSDSEVNLLSDSIDLGRFLQETESSFDAGNQDFFLDEKKNSGVGKVQDISNYVADVNIFGGFVEKNSLIKEEQAEVSLSFSTGLSNGRRSSAISDTITPINSRTNSPGRKTNVNSDSTIRTSISEGMHEKYGTHRIGSKMKEMVSLRPKSFPLSPVEAPRKSHYQRNKKKPSSSSGYNVKPDSLLLLKDEECFFMAAPKSKTNLYLRPERRCPKFQFGVRTSDNVVNVNFKGGFIRNSIMNWYFEPNAPIPDSFQDVTIEYDRQFYPKMLQYIDDKIRPYDSTSRTYWKLIKYQDGPFIKLVLDPQSLDCDPIFSSKQYYFNVVSRIVRPKSFGPIESGARYRAKMVMDMKEDDSSGKPRWCHFITSAEMKGILDFIFDGLDYIANDDTLPDKISKGIKPNPFKQHESRIRSHMVGYVSGKKCLKNSTNIFSGERRFFAEEMYKQVIGYNDKKRPYNTLKEFAVMEVKYLMDNIEDLFGKFYWVDPSTVPVGGYPVRY